MTTTLTKTTAHTLASIFGVTPDYMGDVPPWQDEALCAQTDPEAFFPDEGIPSGEAKRLCKSCPVRQQCLDYALQNNEAYGIWGGLSANQRANLRRERSEYAA